jgi:hypothetical protein
MALKVPNRPDLEDSDYALGGDPNWVANFGNRTGNLGRAADEQGVRFGQGAMDRSNEVGQRAAPSTDFSGANRSLIGSERAGGKQGEVFEGLMGFAQGPQGPSAAQAAIKQGANQSMAQNASLARAGSGFGEGAGDLQDAQRANVSAMQGASNLAAQTAAAEDQAFRAQRLEAFGAGGDVAGAERAGAISEAEARAGMSQFDTTSELTAEQQRDAAAQGWFGQSVDAFGRGKDQGLAAEELGLAGVQSELDARVAQGNTEASLYGTEADVFATREARDRALHEQRRGDRGEVAGVVGSVAGGVAAVLSDERAKTNVTRRDRGMARERALSTEHDSVGGGSYGRAKRDFETYQYGGGRSSASLEDMRSRYEDLEEPEDPDAPPKPLLEGKTGSKFRALAGSFRSLSDERSKQNVRRY